MRLSVLHENADPMRHARQVEVARQDERRVMGEQIANDIRHEVDTLKASSHHPYSPEQYDFMLGLVCELLRSLRDHGVPINVDDFKH
jgi:hypothetical protein